MVVAVIANRTEYRLLKSAFDAGSLLLMLVSFLAVHCVL